jgi:NAD(P) transhydrogenase subunit alpha
MKIMIPNQVHANEARAAVSPGAVKKLQALGVDVMIASGAGVGAYHSDAEYEAAGAKIAADDGALQAIWAEGDVVLVLQTPELEQVQAMRQGAVLIGMLAPQANLDVIKTLADKQVTTFAMEFVPRISRAQAMDVLSSQASIGGYVAVVRAAAACPKIFPMMMTAAGTIAPAKVFVIGAGVAGLQAIATAKRLGARVEAYDVRPVVKEQVQSLGARFVELPVAAEDAETAGGYAKEQTDEQRQQQAELMAKHVIGADVVITTAAIFGKAPPLLIPQDVVAKMKAGAVLIDLAADPTSGRGNCQATKPGETITTDNGVIIDGTLNLAGKTPTDATQMYAANMLAFLKEIVDTSADQPQLKLDVEDDIQKGAMITHDGKVVNEMIATALEASS